MENFLTYEDFTGIIIFDTESNPTRELLNEIISQKQKDLLINLLGYDLYLQFETALDEVSPVQKWLDLRDGVDFSSEYCNKTYTLHFDGVKEMLKYYIAFYYLQEITNRMTFAGQVKSNNENSNVINQEIKLTKLHNKAIDLYGFAYKYDIDIVQFTVPILKLTDEIERVKNTCFNFLYTKNETSETTYPNWIFSPKKYIF